MLKSEVPVVNIDEIAQVINTARKTMTAIPYYAWAHRGKGEMVVWFPSSIKDVDIITSEASAEIKGK